MTMNDNGTLFVVATPIGNLSDISQRALDTLRSVGIVVAEDTRVTRKLLNHFNITVDTISCHQHTNPGVFKNISCLLTEGKSAALVTDAGTPGISDPGGQLVEYVTTNHSNIQVVPLPGPSAVSTILSVAGIPADTYTFMGFPPHKKGRQTYFNTVADTPHTVVFFESNHRILKALNSLAELMPDRWLVVGRELTKVHESIYRGYTRDMVEKIESDPTKGEYVVVVSPQNYKSKSES